MEQLLGIEGSAARMYFKVYRCAFRPELGFSRRVRRPPKDPVNALLSLGYTFLGHAMMAALEVVGLDPYLGFFHSEKYGRPALALDLIEEFRAPIVDSLVLMLLNCNMIHTKNFSQSSTSGEVRLNDKGMHIFLEKFSQKLDKPLKTREIGRAISYRKHFEVQARKLAHLIDGTDTQYKPFRIR
jgi:CRISPR-associated protein Cas1